MVTRWFALALALALALTARTATADRVKDLTTVAGVRTNQLTGYGLVVGLAGTGDDASSPIVRRSSSDMPPTSLLASIGRGSRGCWRE